MIVSSIAPTFMIFLGFGVQDCITIHHKHNQKTNLHDIPHVLSGDFSRGEFTPGVSSQSCLVMV